MKDYTLKEYWSVAFENVGLAACVTIAAIHFDKWWILLLFPLVMTTIKRREKKKFDAFEEF